MSLNSINIFMMIMSRKSILIVFAHYNKDNNLDDYVVYYVKNLLKLSFCKKLIFVSTSNLPEDHELKEEKKINFIERENEGYDFYSFKIGLESTNYKNYDGIIFCNDSVFGPFFDLENYIEQELEKKDCVSGMTKSYEYFEHLQSYFLIFGCDIIRSKFFNNFWNLVEIQKTRKDIIDNYEIGLSKGLKENGIKLNSWVKFKPSIGEFLLFSGNKTFLINHILKCLLKFNFKKIYALNVTHFYWKYIIIKEKYPFFKKELLLKNPKNISIALLFETINNQTNYPVKLIEDFNSSRNKM